MKPKINERCGDCIFWIPAQVASKDLVIGAAKRGECYGAPPQVVPIINQGQMVGGMNIRPQVAENDVACSFYTDEFDEDSANDPAH